MQRWSTNFVFDWIEISFDFSTETSFIFRNR